MCWISPANLVLLLRTLYREGSSHVYGPAMKKLGFVSKARKADGNVTRAWVRGEPAVNEPGYGPQLGSSGTPMKQYTAPPLAPGQAVTLRSVPPLPY